MKWINVDEKLPDNNSYVLVHLVNQPWLASDDPKGNRFFKVVKFRMGISQAERESRNIKVIRSEDEWGNNQRNYNWSEFGPGSYFGQEVDYWMEIPHHPQQEC